MITKNNLRFIAVIMIGGIALTSCQTKPTDTKTEIKQVDTPLVAPEDGMKQPQDTITPKADTTKKAMKDEKKPLTIVIDNLESPTATVEISVYSPESKFPKEDGQLKKYRLKPVAGKLTATITDLSYGQYAIAAYQDLDEDGKIGKNMIGIPTDPYGFSNNYKPKIKAPAFKDCQFDYDGKSAAVSFSMIKKKS